MRSDEELSWIAGRKLYPYVGERVLLNASAPLDELVPALLVVGEARPPALEPLGDVVGVVGEILLEVVSLVRLIEGDHELLDLARVRLLGGSRGSEEQGKGGCDHRMASRFAVGTRPDELY